MNTNGSGFSTSCNLGCKWAVAALCRGMLWAWLSLLDGTTARAANFSTGDNLATKFGVHEIALRASGTAANPFDVIATVKFVPPSGEANSKSVPAFYDGDNTWRARVYVSEVGSWKWSSTCATDKGLDGKSETFKAADSKLRGRLLIHPKNSRQWITDDGRWFLNLNDTAYFLLCARDADGGFVTDEVALQYMRDDIARGISSIRCFLAGRREGFDESPEQWRGWYFANETYDQFRLENLQSADRRLRLFLDEFPDVAVQLILLPRGVRYAGDEQVWKTLTGEQKERILRNLVARFAAFPQLFWLITNDAHYGNNFPNNNAMVREVGAYLKQHDPWQHPRSTGHARRVPFYFGGEDWVNYVHIEHAHDLGAAEYEKYHALAKPVFLGEDRYEQDHGPAQDPAHMRYWQRRLFWAWLLSNGSTNYGGRWPMVHPYSETGKLTFHNQHGGRNYTFRTALHGLDSVRPIRDYFATRKIELSDFEPDHSLASDQNGGPEARAPKLMRRGQEEFRLYHPNAAADERDAHVNTERTASVRLDLRQANGPFAVEWYRAHDGIAKQGEQVPGGKETELVAPWPGHDVVLRLQKAGKR